MKTYKVNYPDNLMFWNREKSDKNQLKVINEEDFPLKETLSGLGIYSTKFTDSFGITDEEEIKRRIRNMKFLNDNPEFSKWIGKLSSSSSTFWIPGDGNKFTEFYRSSLDHNPYWQTVYEFIELVNSIGDVTPEIEELKNHLVNSLPLENSEKEFAGIVGEQIESIAVIEGIARFRVSMNEVEVFEGSSRKKGAKKVARYQVSGLSEEKVEVHGHRKHSFALTEANCLEYPKWTRTAWNPINWIGIGAIARGVIGVINNSKRKMAYRQMTVKRLSWSMRDDLEKAVMGRFKNLNFEDRDLANGNVDIYFSYSQDGLRVMIYHIGFTDSKTHWLQFTDFQGYDKEQLKKMKEIQMEFHKKIRERVEGMRSARLMRYIEEKRKMFFESFKAESPAFDKEHKWFALVNFYNSPGLRRTHRVLMNHRGYFQRHIQTLDGMRDLVNRIATEAQNVGTDICFPEILSNGSHIVSFEEIIPVHLLQRDDIKPKDLVPIHRLPELNGQMIGITGFHGGGKTVTELATAINIYLAQSGLPVLGRGHFRLNVKKVLGMTFIDKGVDSTCTLLLGKIRNILKGIKGYSGNEVVLVLDELGANTQELSGYELGKDVLDKFAKSGVSVLFSTQITQLAEYAQNDLGAQCFKVDTKHNITPGIGDGGMNQLRKKMGLTKSRLLK